jgi:hypothetical protein
MPSLCSALYFLKSAWDGGRPHQRQTRQMASSNSSSECFSERVWPGTAIPSAVRALCHEPKYFATALRLIRRCGHTSNRARVCFAVAVEFAKRRSSDSTSSLLGPRASRAPYSTPARLSASIQPPSWAQIVRSWNRLFGQLR